MKRIGSGIIAVNSYALLHAEQVDNLPSPETNITEEEPADLLLPFCFPGGGLNGVPSSVVIYGGIAVLGTWATTRLINAITRLVQASHGIRSLQTSQG